MTLCRVDTGHPTYSVYTRFRRSRLAVLRCASEAQAFEFAARLRAERFHDPEGVFVVEDSSGRVVGVPDEVRSRDFAELLPSGSRPCNSPTKSAVAAPNSRPAEDLLARARRCVAEGRAHLESLNANLEVLYQLVANARQRGAALQRH